MIFSTIRLGGVESDRPDGLERTDHLPRLDGRASSRNAMPAVRYSDSPALEMPEGDRSAAQSSVDPDDRERGRFVIRSVACSI